MFKEIENKKITKEIVKEKLVNFTKELDLNKFIEKEKTETYTFLNKEYKSKTINFYTGKLQNNKNNNDDIIVKIDKREVPLYFLEEEKENEVVLKTKKFYPQNVMRVDYKNLKDRFFGELNNGILKQQHGKTMLDKITVNFLKKENINKKNCKVEVEKNNNYEDSILKYLGDYYLKEVDSDYKDYVLNIFKNNVLTKISKEGKVTKFKFKNKVLEMFSGYKNWDLKGKNLHEILKNNKDFNLVIAADTEFINVVGNDNKEDTVLLSSQYAFYWDGYIYTFTYICKKVYGAKLGVKTFLQHILRFIDKYLFVINTKHKETNKRLNITLLHHFGRADLQHFKDFETIFFKGFATQIQGGIESVKPLTLNIKYKNNVKQPDLEYRVFINFRDTMCYCSGEKSLARQTQEQFFKKIDDPNINKGDMLGYLINNTSNFIKYADMDAVSTLELAYKLFGFNCKYPFTIGQSSVNSFIDCTMEKIFGSAIENPKEIFAFLYNGSFKNDIETTDSNGKLVNKAIFTHLNLNITNNLNYYTHAFHGGLNQCYTRGYYSILTTDFDLTSAYPTLMSCLPFVNMLVPFDEFVDISPEEALKKLENLKEFNVACAVVDWDYTLACNRYKNHSCIAQKIQNNLVFTTKGSNVSVAGADLYRALSLGVITKIEKLIIPKILENEYIFKDYYKKTIKLRNKFKKKFGKKSVQQEIIKLKNNSLYGKTAQGLSSSSISSYINKIKVTEQMPCCDLTNPIYAACITALVRTYLTDVIALLEEKDYTVHSVTTDGFITNLNDIKLLDKLTQEDYYIKDFTLKILEICREIQDNNILNSIWEIKHINIAFFNITTRGNFAINPEGVLAAAGAKVLKRFKTREKILHYLLKYNGKVRDKFLKLTTLTEMLLNNEILAGIYIHKDNFFIEFDGKNIPLLETNYLTKLELKNKTFEVLNFKTRQPRDKEEYLSFKRLLKKYKNATYNKESFYKLMQEFTSSGEIENTKNRNTTKTKNSEYTEAKNFLTNYLTKLVDKKIIKYFKSYIRQEIVEFININFLEFNNKKLTKNIFENIQKQIKKIEDKEEIKKLDAGEIENKILKYIKSKK